MVNKITSCITLRAYILKIQKCLETEGFYFENLTHFVPSVSRCCLLCTRMCVTNRSSWWKWFAFIKISAHHSFAQLELSVAELLLYQAQVKTEIFNNLCQHTASQCDLNLSEIIRRCTCGVTILGVHAKRLPAQRADDNTPSVCYGWWGELE